MNSKNIDEAAEIEALAEKEYPFDGMCKTQLIRAFKTGYKAALNNPKPTSPNIEQVLQKIAQMSDSGNPERTIIEMKRIALAALKLP